MLWSALYGLPTGPVLASEMASRRAAWPPATAPVRTAAVLETAGLAASPVVAAVATATIRGCCIPASSPSAASEGTSEGSSAAMLWARILLGLLDLWVLRIDHCGGAAGLAPLPLSDRLGLLADLAGRRHLFQQVQRHLGVDVCVWMDGVRRPPGPEGLLDPFLAAASPADKLNTVQNDGRAELLAQGEFQFGQICQNLAQEIRILKICDVLRDVTARHGDVPCYRCDDVQNVLTELRDDSPELLDGELDGPLWRHHQRPVDVVAIVLLHALGDWYETPFFSGCQKT